MSSITSKLNQAPVNVIVSFPNQESNPFVIGKNSFRNAVCKDLGVLPVDSKVSVNYGKKNRTASVIIHFAYAASAERIAEKARKAFKKNAIVKIA